MTYQVLVSRQAHKALAGLPRKEQRRIAVAIDLLADHPRPPKCIALQGERDIYRIRVGDYRIVYFVQDDRLIIEVIRIGHRRDVYR